MSSTIDQIRKQMRERQIERIKSLEVGRELDALVAKYVMGLQVETWRPEPAEPVDYWYRSKSGINIEDEEVERVPNYSTVLFSAEKVILKFSDWMIRANPEGHGIDADFSMHTKYGTAIEQCATLAEAICKAALIAVVEEDKIIEQLLVD